MFMEAVSHSSPLDGGLFVNLGRKYTFAYTRRKTFCTLFTFRPDRREFILMMAVNSRVTAVQLASISPAQESSLHLLPCELEHNGPAYVDRFFSPTIKECKHEKTVSFRGRGLMGQDVPCPQGYTGLVLKEVQRPASDQEDRIVKVSSLFHNFTYWNLETTPTSDDRIVMAMSWPKLAEIMHAPVED